MRSNSAFAERVDMIHAQVSTVTLTDSSVLMMSSIGTLKDQHSPMKRELLKLRMLDSMPLIELETLRLEHLLFTQDLTSQPRMMEHLSLENWRSWDSVLD